MLSGQVSSAHKTEQEEGFGRGVSTNLVRLTIFIVINDPAELAIGVLLAVLEFAIYLELVGLCCYGKVNSELAKCKTVWGKRN